MRNIEEAVEGLLAWGSKSTARWLLVSLLMAALAMLSAAQVVYVLLPVLWLLSR